MSTEKGKPFASIGVGNSVDHIERIGVARVKESVQAEARLIEREMEALIGALRQLEPGASAQG